LREIFYYIKWRCADIFSYTRVRMRYYLFVINFVFALILLHRGVSPLLCFLLVLFTIYYVRTITEREQKREPTTQEFFRGTYWTKSVGR
jgi:hypothetical protein